jgi:uncharacterized damage-inducible protein DinB
MEKEMIRSLLGYDSWANERVLACCDQLTQDQFLQEDVTPWGSIRSQFVHQFLIQRRWLSWADGSLSGEHAYALEADPADYPDLASIRQMWQVNDVQANDFAKRATSADLVRELRIEFPGFSMALPAWQALVHTCNHSMQHRTEVTVALTRFGASPGDVDYIFFALE